MVASNVEGKSSGSRRWGERVVNKYSQCGSISLGGGGGGGGDSSLTGTETSSHSSSSSLCLEEADTLSE